MICHKMAAVYLLIVFFAFGCVNAKKCSTVYSRFSSKHTMCIPRNRTCNIKERGVTDDEKNTILDIHNKYRSKVATGNEDRGGGLPTASDMMQMEWDDELSKVAQKWAEHCVFEHDCNECREVENFSVGQNIAYYGTKCSNPTQKCLRMSKDWASPLKQFYEEIDDFSKKYVAAVKFVGSKQYGHFTQMIWAKSWKIGCGYVEYGTNHRHFFVCNYGPGGNVLNMPIYEEGKPCSGCPTNSCCDKSCKDKKNTYPGLCKMKSSNEAPIYKHEEDLLFYCGFNKEDTDCKRKVEGVSKWKTKYVLQGTYITIVLKGGENTTLKFHKEIVPTTSAFCLKSRFRKGPLIKGKSDTSTLKLGMEAKGYLPTEMTLRLSSNSFSTFSSSLSWGAPTKFSLTFSVPKGSPDHVLDITEITANNGGCSKN